MKCRRHQIQVEIKKSLRCFVTYTSLLFWSCLHSLPNLLSLSFLACMQYKEGKAPYIMLAWLHPGSSKRESNPNTVLLWVRVKVGKTCHLAVTCYFSRETCSPNNANYKICMIGVALLIMRETTCYKDKGRDTHIVCFFFFFFKWKIYDEAIDKWWACGQCLLCERTESSVLC